MKKTLQRISMLLVAAVAALTAHADAISMNDLTLDPNGKGKLEISYSKTTDVSSMSMLLALPEGVTATAIERNGDRIDRSEFGLTIDRVAQGWLIILTGSAGEPVMEDEGVLFTVTLTANDFYVPGKAVLSDIKLSTVDGKKAVLEDVTAQVNATSIGDFSFSTESFIPKPEEWTRLGVRFSNKATVMGIQATLTLPEGLEIETNKRGKINFIYGSRLADDVSILYNEVAPGKYAIAIAGTDGSNLGRNGELFAINVKGAVEEEQAITLDDIYVSLDGNMDVPNTGASVAVKPDTNKKMWEAIGADVKQVTDAAAAYAEELAKLEYASQAEPYATLAADAAGWAEAVLAEKQEKYEAGTLTTEDGVAEAAQEWIAKLDIEAAAQYDAEATAQANKPKRGDVNADGDISIEDYTKLVNIVLGREEKPAEGSEAYEVCDVNEDGKIGIADVTKLAQIINN